jgi:leader peptidase (prepilin peptidase) / N-methyltransferase
LFPFESFYSYWVQMLLISGIFAGLFGLVMGSFLNVFIYRWPLGQSVVRPSRSYCPACKKDIAWYDNIPLLSYLILRGRCRHCSESISWRYPSVEVLTSLVSVVILLRFQNPAEYFVYFVLFSAPLIAISFIDLKHYLIPDLLSLPGIFVGTLVHVLLGPQGPVDNLLQAGLGIVVGGGTLFVISWVYEKLRHREGIGGGDVKLAAMIGAFLGWQAVIIILFLSSLFGTVIGLIVLLIRRKGLSQAIPYGPFLALAAWFYLLYGRDLVHWYLQLAVS